MKRNAETLPMQGVPKSDFILIKNILSTFPRQHLGFLNELLNPQHCQSPPFLTLSHPATSLTLLIGYKIEVEVSVELRLVDLPAGQADNPTQVGPQE